MRFSKYIMYLCFIHAFHLMNTGVKARATPTCQLPYKETKGGISKYRIAINSTDRHYTPKQIYNITLQAKNSLLENPNKFNGFMLISQLKDTADNGALSPGIFKLNPGEQNVKIDEICPNTIVHTSNAVLSSIDVLWIAPDNEAACVQFRAAVLESSVWYKSSSGMDLEVCATDVIENENIPDKCKSCNEAKYEMNFEGMWTRQSHPRSYPDNAWLTRFSDVIGASHDVNYRFWRTGENASQALIEFAEGDNKTLLETDIKGSKIRTMIKAKGLSYPNITGKTFAAFRVDPEHHLISLISFLRPSPDWFVGISGLPLCDIEGKWISQKNIDLFPYDLGLWGDVLYESKSETKGEPIFKIMESNDTNFPFYSTTEDPLKPLARVHLKKLREYEKTNCEPTAESDKKNGPVADFFTSMSSTGTVDEELTTDNPTEDTPITKFNFTENDCEKVQFSKSDCSTPSCDSDRVRIQYRLIDNMMLMKYCQSTVGLEKIEACTAEVCSYRMEQEIKSLAVKCTATSWPSSFLPCDTTQCVRNRTRTASDPMKKKIPECAKVVWVQEIKCRPEECQYNSK